MKARLSIAFAALAAILVGGCAPVPTPTPSATIIVTFDLALGGSGFSESIYLQDVNSGKTYTGLYSSGAHGGVILPTSAPVVFQVDAPGTYIVYANMINAPEDYHFGMVGCPAGDACTAGSLHAIDVVPGGTYQVYLSDRPGERHAPVPTPHAPVSVPWQR